MKKFVLYTLLSLVTLGLIGYIYISVTPPASPLETVTFQENGNDISITYSRPYKKDRLIFGEESDGALVPFNKYWRTGANNHTTIELKNSITIDNNTLNSGLYSIYILFPEKIHGMLFLMKPTVFGVLCNQTLKKIYLQSLSLQILLINQLSNLLLILFHLPLTDLLQLE